MNPECWCLEGHIARLHLLGLSVAFDADRPAEGLKNIITLDRPWPMGRLLGISESIQSVANCVLTDWYVRGDDLIAVYETGQPDAARIDMLWHVARPVAGAPWIARIDLLVSIRTDRLDWRLDMGLESIIPAADEFQEFSGIDWFAGNDWDWSLALMVHPADLRHREVRAALGLPGARHLRHQLFPAETLEKGVILRARATALFLHAGAEVAAIAKSYRDFTAADPPLA